MVRFTGIELGFTQEEMRCLIQWYHENEGLLHVEDKVA